MTLSLVCFVTRTLPWDTSNFTAQISSQLFIHAAYLYDIKALSLWGWRVPCIVILDV